MKFDLIIIRSGPGSYVAAIRRRKLESKAAIVERERLGGICPLGERASKAHHAGVLVPELDWRGPARLTARHGVATRDGAIQGRAAEGARYFLGFRSRARRCASATTQLKRKNVASSRYGISTVSVACGRSSRGPWSRRPQKR